MPPAATHIPFRNGIFITGTDSGVGKTHIGCRLTQYCHAQGLAIQPRKPVESGCQADDQGKLWPGDGLAYHVATDGKIPLDNITPFRLPHALSPARAAALQNLQLTITALHQAAIRCTHPEDILLVEGAGGFHSPLASDGLNSDLASVLQLPILLVVQNRLGCINHTLLTLQAIAQQNLTTLAIILNQTNPSPDPSTPYNATDLRKLCNIPIINTPFSPIGDTTPWEKNLLALISQSFR